VPFNFHASILQRYVQVDPDVLEYDPARPDEHRQFIPERCDWVEVQGSKVPCIVTFQDMGLASLAGGSRSAILAELMPALGKALSSPQTEEELDITGSLAKQLDALGKSADEMTAAHLIAARAHLKAVLALSARSEVCLISSWH
jgi:hypothetical protein